LITMLYVPGADAAKLAKVGTLGASAYILDLEDAVASSAKPRARRQVADTVRACGGDALVWVRVNPGDSGMLLEDLRAVVEPGLAGVVLPKAEAATDLLSLDAVLGLLERERELDVGSVRLIPTIETVRGLTAVDEIAGATPRTLCLAFGAGDFSLDLGLDWPPASGTLSPTIVAAKVEVVLASRRAGLERPHDGVFPNFRAPRVLRSEAEQARALGFHGKHAMHPDQVAVIAEVFTLTEQELAAAGAVLDAHERGLELGIGNVHIDGRFIDQPVAEHARRVIAAADGRASPPRADDEPPAALDGLRVLDLSSLYAAPLISTNLGDFGASVVKVEHPRGDDARRWGLSKDEVPLWWKTIARNKRVVALDLNEEDDRAVVRRLAEDADVLLENFRPGRLESWGLGPEQLHARNRGLVIVRVTGFGQTGPYADQPGFGTLAEAFSGFAHMTGLADGPPTLPPFGLADAITGLVGTYATLAALRWRDGAGQGEGQIIDLSLYEPLFSILGPQITEFTELGVIQDRQGNRSARTAPRNVYSTADGRWVAISAGTQQIANRIFASIECPELATDARFRDSAGRRANADEIDALVAGWIAERSLTEVLTRFAELGAPIAPVYDVSQINDDPHYRAREAFVVCEDADLGQVTIPAIVPRLSRTPGRIRWTGPAAVGADTERVLAALRGPRDPGAAFDVPAAGEVPARRAPR
jgi:crotonobetainyl-CoA:carnitine CoA-transferase CaiB-like acyl-CoA transferase/citrate lyase beta subunit